MRGGGDASGGVDGESVIISGVPARFAVAARAHERTLERRQRAHEQEQADVFERPMGGVPESERPAEPTSGFDWSSLK